MSYMHVCMCIPFIPIVHGGKKRPGNEITDSLWAAIEVLGIKTESSARAAIALKHWTLQPQCFKFLNLAALMIFHGDPSFLGFMAPASFPHTTQKWLMLQLY